MKRATTIFILSLCALAASAQQPRLPQVDTYLNATGQPIATPQSAISRHFPILLQRYRPGQRLYLDAPLFREKGLRSIMPFGFVLSPASEIPMATTQENRQCSEKMPLHNTDYFTSVAFQFCDSMVYGIRLELRDAPDRMAELTDELRDVFGAADYDFSHSAAYSDPDFAVRFDKSARVIEISSLFHYPGVEDIYPSVRQKSYWGPMPHYLSETEAVRLLFLNQESKENNVQTALKLFSEGTDPLVFETIRFFIDNNDLLQYEIAQNQPDSRTFLMPEELKRLVRAHHIEVEVEGGGETRRWTMPKYQWYSLYTAFEYFRWQVTNRYVKYPGI